MAHDYARKQRRPAKGSKSRKSSAPSFNLRTMFSLLVIVAFGWGLVHLYQSKQSQRPNQVAKQGAESHLKQKADATEASGQTNSQQSDGYSYTFYQKLKESQSYDPVEIVELRPAKGEKTKTPEAKTTPTTPPASVSEPKPAALQQNAAPPVPRPRPETAAAPLLLPPQAVPSTQQASGRPRPNTSPSTVAPASKTLINYPKNAILQAGSYQSYTEANNQRAQLIMNGVRNPRITIVTLPNGQVSHHIELGPFRSAQELELTRQRLSKLKIKSSVHAE